MSPPSRVSSRSYAARAEASDTCCSRIRRTSVGRPGLARPELRQAVPLDDRREVGIGRAELAAAAANDVSSSIPRPYTAGVQRISSGRRTLELEGAARCRSGRGREHEAADHMARDHRGVQVGQPGARLDAELVDEHRAGVAVGARARPPGDPTGRAPSSGAHAGARGADAPRSAPRARPRRRRGARGRGPPRPAARAPARGAPRGAGDRIEQRARPQGRRAPGRARGRAPRGATTRHGPDRPCSSARLPWCASSSNRWRSSAPGSTRTR